MRRYCVLIFLLSIGLRSWGQDMIYDMSYGNRIAMNPAFAGNDGNGKFRASLAHHSQFVNNRGPFNFSSASFDYKFCKSPLTFGLLAQNEIQGDGFLSTNSISPIIGALFPGKNSFVSFGVKLSFINYSVDWSRYVFSDQLDPVFGVGPVSSNSNVGTISDFTNGISGGVNYTRWQRRAAWNIGLAGNHIVAPRYSLLDYTRKLPFRITLHSAVLLMSGQYKNKINNALEFAGRFDYQDIFRTGTLTGGWYANQYVFVGIGGRLSSDPLQSSVKPLMEIRLMPSVSWRIQILYGYNVSRNSSGLGNSFEIGLSYVPSLANCSISNLISNIWTKNKRRESAGKNLTCPVFQNAQIGTGTF